MSISLRIMAEPEQKYSFKQTMQFNSMCGAVGYLRGNFGRDGNEFHSTWFDIIKEHKTPEFQQEFDNVINALRDDIKYRGLLRNLDDMKMLCHTRPSSKIKIANEMNCYGFRVDSDKYSYLIRCMPHKGDYNFYVYAYNREWLNQHIQRAEKGIRFITPDYKELFRVKDGGKVHIISPDGAESDKECRYIDEYHAQIGSNIYHICEFAEIMERNSNTVKPLDAQPRAKDFER